MSILSSDVTGSTDISDETEQDSSDEVVVNSAGRSAKIVVERAGESLGLSLAPHPQGTAVHATNSAMPDKQRAVGMIMACIVPRGPPRAKGRCLLGLEPAAVAAEIKQMPPPYTMYFDEGEDALYERLSEGVDTDWDDSLNVPADHRGELQEANEKVLALEHQLGAVQRKLQAADGREAQAANKSKATIAALQARLDRMETDGQPTEAAEAGWAQERLQLSRELNGQQVLVSQLESAMKQAAQAASERLHQVSQALDESKQLTNEVSNEQSAAIEQLKIELSRMKRELQGERAKSQELVDQTEEATCSRIEKLNAEKDASVAHAASQCCEVDALEDQVMQLLKSLAAEKMSNQQASADLCSEFELQVNCDIDPESTTTSADVTSRPEDLIVLLRAQLDAAQNAVAQGKRREQQLEADLVQLPDSDVLTGLQVERDEWKQVKSALVEQLQKLEASLAATKGSPSIGAVLDTSHQPAATAANLTLKILNVPTAGELQSDGFSEQIIELHSELKEMTQLKAASEESERSLQARLLSTQAEIDMFRRGQMRAGESELQVAQCQLREKLLNEQLTGLKLQLETAEHTVDCRVAELKACQLAAEAAASQAKHESMLLAEQLLETSEELLREKNTHKEAQVLQQSLRAQQEELSCISGQQEKRMIAAHTELASQVAEHEQQQTIQIELSQKNQEQQVVLTNMQVELQDARRAQIEAEEAEAALLAQSRDREIETELAYSVLARKIQEQEALLAVSRKELNQATESASRLLESADAEWTQERQRLRQELLNDKAEWLLAQTTLVGHAEGEVLLLQKEDIIQELGNERHRLAKVLTDSQADLEQLHGSEQIKMMGDCLGERDEWLHVKSALLEQVQELEASLAAMHIANAKVGTQKAACEATNAALGNKIQEQDDMLDNARVQIAELNAAKACWQKHHESLQKDFQDAEMRCTKAEAELSMVKLENQKFGITQNDLVKKTRRQKARSVVGNKVRRILEQEELQKQRVSSLQFCDQRHDEWSTKEAELLAAVNWLQDELNRKARELECSEQKFNVLFSDFASIAEGERVMNPGLHNNSLVVQNNLVKDEQNSENRKAAVQSVQQQQFMSRLAGNASHSTRNSGRNKDHRVSNVIPI